MSDPTEKLDLIVRARVIFPGISSHQAATTLFVRCGACGQRLPDLWYAQNDGMLAHHYRKREHVVEEVLRFALASANMRWKSGR